MAAEPQDFEPEKLTAGVTWNWKKLILTILQANGLDLLPPQRRSNRHKLYRNGRRRLFLVTVAASTTSSYAAGVYDFIGVVSKAAEKFIVFDGVLKVLTNPASLPLTIIQKIQKTFDSRAILLNLHQTYRV